MSAEILPSFRAMAGNWVVKKNASLPPKKLTSEELNQLVLASVETLSQRALGLEEQEWGSLERLTQEWIVQRERGTAPGPLNAEDFRQFVRFVLEGMARPVAAASPEDETGSLPSPVEGAINETVLPDGRRVADVLKEDPFYFAREHLASCL